MSSSFDLQEELQALQDIVNYPIEHEHDINSMDPAEMDGLLQRALFAIPLPLNQRERESSRYHQRPSAQSRKPPTPSHLPTRSTS